MKLAVCQLPNNLSVQHPAWHDLLARIEQEQPDLAILNEMPFGDWLAGRAVFDPGLAAASVNVHKCALSALQKMPCAVLSSRPVAGPHTLSNEAFLVAGGTYQVLHHKHYFPQEDGFYEDSWFAPQRSGFEVLEYCGLRLGVLLCTELMFTEWARHYRRQGAHVIVVPRASGTSMRNWHAAAAMAAIVSGCYVLSSNRAATVGDSESNFGGRGFVYAPGGELLVETSLTTPFACVEIDFACIADAQENYPCYVPELQS